MKSKKSTKSLKTGSTKDFYENGNVRYTGSLKGGKMHGSWKFFRKDGSLMRTGQFMDGKQVGIWRTYDRSEKLAKETKITKQKR